MQSYGVAPDSSTGDYCENWRSGDYQVQVALTGSNASTFAEPDAARAVVYSGGSVEGYDASGQYQQGDYAGASAFEYVDATSDEQQASYDNPYYGVWSGGGGGGG